MGRTRGGYTLAILDSYAVLLLVPMLCVPVQLLYLKFGHRYDLGILTYVSAGAFLSASWSIPTSRTVPLRIASVLLAALLGAFLVRLAAMGFGRPSDFTLVTFGQLWATPALIDYELRMLTKSAGIPVRPLNWHPGAVVLAACMFAALLGYTISRTEVPDRILALTESSIQYRLLFGSPLGLAIRVEGLALGVYLLAGILMGLTMNDLSPSAFGMESIWCVLAASLAARTSSRYVFIGPLAAIAIRFGIKSLVPTRFATTVVYAVFAAAIMWVASQAQEASRDAGTQPT